MLGMRATAVTVPGWSSKAVNLAPAPRTEASTSASGAPAPGVVTNPTDLTAAEPPLMPLLRVVGQKVPWSPFERANELSVMYAIAMVEFPTW